MGKRQTKRHRVIVLCNHCKAPTQLPREVELNIQNFKDFECWECKKLVPIHSDLRYFIYATRSDGFDYDRLN